MKKTSLYLILIILGGLLVVSFWLYQRYFKAQEARAPAV